MSDNDRGPDYETECGTVNVAELEEEVNTTINTRLVKTKTELLSVQKDRRTSLIWSKFTVVNRTDKIASCNICGAKLCFKSTSYNLKKHLERKHNYYIKEGVVNKRANRPKYITPRPRPKLSELAGISEDGITVKVVGENGETEHFQLIDGEDFIREDAVHEEEVHEHDYSSVEQRMDEGEVIEIGGDGEAIESEQPMIEKIISVGEERTFHRNDSPRQYAPSRSANSFASEKSKRNRMMDLQIECLENKKYNMQLEALNMEQQLNLPRSIFTQTLRYSDVQSRSTQTDVGGSDTRVFYVTNGRGGRPIQQLFAFQDLDM